MRDSNSRPLGPKPSALAIWANSRERMVGVGGLEPPTSPLSEVRSNRLSYTPILFSIIFSGAKRQNRTADTRLFRPLLYHWATLAFPFGVHQRYFSFLPIHISLFYLFIFLLLCFSRNRTGVFIVIYLLISRVFLWQKSNGIDIGIEA